MVDFNDIETFKQAMQRYTDDDTQGGDFYRCCYDALNYLIAIKFCQGDLAKASALMHSWVREKRKAVTTDR